MLWSERPLYLLLTIFFMCLQLGTRVYSESDLQILSSHMKKEIDDEVNKILEVNLKHIVYIICYWVFAILSAFAFADCIEKFI